MADWNILHPYGPRIIDGATQQAIGMIPYEYHWIVLRIEVCLMCVQIRLYSPPIVKVPAVITAYIARLSAR